MKPGITALAVCFALVLGLLSGCGSSSSSTATSSTAAKAPTTSTSSGGLKANTTPKYAAPSASAPVQSGTVQIAYRNIAIDPDTVKVKLGSTIKWTNHDSVEHNVTSQGGGQKFASKDFGESGTFEIKANKPGVIHYLCTIHPASMNGTIEVLK
jgi:plastocyanin